MIWSAASVALLGTVQAKVMFIGQIMATSKDVGCHESVPAHPVEKRHSPSTNPHDNPIPTKSHGIFSIFITLPVYALITKLDRQTSCTIVWCHFPLWFWTFYVTQLLHILLWSEIVLSWITAAIINWSEQNFKQWHWRGRRWDASLETLGTIGQGLPKWPRKKTSCQGYNLETTRVSMWSSILLEKNCKVSQKGVTYPQNPTAKWLQIVFLLTLLHTLRLS